MKLCSHHPTDAMHGGIASSVPRLQLLPVAPAAYHVCARLGRDNAAVSQLGRPPTGENLWVPNALASQRMPQIFKMHTICSTWRTAPASSMAEAAANLVIHDPIAR